MTNRLRFTRRALPVFLVFLAACSNSRAVVDQEAGPAEDTAIRAYFDVVRAAYSGERALETVAFVAPRWRVAGNTGFDASIHHVAERLEQAGYIREEQADPDQALTYRLEHRPMQQPAWEPIDASLTIVGQETPVLRLATNRNMLAIYSFSTPEGGVEADLVYVGRGRAEDFEGVDVEGKIVFGEAEMRPLFAAAVQQRGAVGVLAYSMPDYTRPERYQHSIRFSNIPLDEGRRGWGLMVSYAVRAQLKAALEAGPARVRVTTETRMYEAEELTLVADVKGREQPDERFVFSAHVQEPGANDNASGVGVLTEIARVTAALMRRDEIAPRRTLTFLWGDEIRSTRRYIEEDRARAAGIRWGLSLDMVGEDTDKTGGTFLIEKMPDPSAIWTRGEDQHTEWGGRALTEAQMTPHYFNDFALNRCRNQAAETGWVVRTNPYEGGSDHVPFLRAGIPSLLFWHFTDVFYHTDGDLIDKVSPQTMQNVGVCALVTALTLVSADGETAEAIAAEVEQAALERLAAEWTLSQQEIDQGVEPEAERHIVETWTDWYVKAARTLEEVEVGGSSPATRRRIEAVARRIEAAGRDYARRLGTIE